MAEKVKQKDFSVNTILGPSSTVYGDVVVGGFTRVDGNLYGDLNVKGRIVIGEKARLKSNVAGSFITIGGVVYGNIMASECLIILSTGLVLGDILTRRIQADDGCMLHGKIVVCKDEYSWQHAFAEYQDAQLVKQVLAKGVTASKDVSGYDKS
ncbi:MAG: polymer-forming cytoskeletal protein [Spirochaetaceae bacterium]|jgi:cytoskeletal protein CcmA (bactofilin family)|nr:polymer-forming cytoskeletal protein [Spirochaetaceae bacterium]